MQELLNIDEKLDVWDQPEYLEVLRGLIDQYLIDKSLLLGTKRGYSQRKFLRDVHKFNEELGNNASNFLISSGVFSDFMKGGPFKTRYLKLVLRYVASDEFLSVVPQARDHFSSYERVLEVGRGLFSHFSDLGRLEAVRNLDICGRWTQEEEKVVGWPKGEEAPETYRPLSELLILSLIHISEPTRPY